VTAKVSRSTDITLLQNGKTSDHKNNTEKLTFVWHQQNIVVLNQLAHKLPCHMPSQLSCHRLHPHQLGFWGFLFLPSPFWLKPWQKLHQALASWDYQAMVQTNDSLLGICALLAERQNYWVRLFFLARSHQLHYNIVNIYHSHQCVHTEILSMDSDLPTVLWTISKQSKSAKALTGW